jgi:hypothetical protein
LTISAISISRLVGPLVDLELDCFGISLPVGVLIALSLVCRVFGPTECDSLRRGYQSVNIDDELSQSEPVDNTLPNCSQVEPQQETDSLKRQKTTFGYQSLLGFNTS